MEISIKVSGPGILEKEFNNIFKLFFQSNLGKNTKGTGIGLALTKELISLHKGKIDVTSSSENGIFFSVKLSTNENTFSQDEKITIEHTNDLITSIENEFRTLEIEYKQDNIPVKKNYTLLIVEDNIKMQIFLLNVLKNSYNILIAENGEEGIELAKKHLPDLIISDIMMPKMDGLEMCKLLQNKKLTSHIPIILLTAKNSSETKLKGLETGAIEFIKKPFNFHELLFKVSNILRTKENVIAKYKIDLISSLLLKISRIIR